MQSILNDRAAGTPYSVIALHHDMTVPKVRYIVKRAILRGEVTAEQMHLKPMRNRKPGLSDEAYRKRLYDRLVAKVRKDENGCWLWTGPYWKDRPWPQNRYGYIGVFRNGKSKTTGTHRAMMIALHGWLRPEQVVCHKCDVPLCINPDHLFIGSMKANIWDSRIKNRHHEGQKTHCIRGHELSGDNVLLVRQAKPKTGWARHCKACARRRQRIKAGWTPEQADLLPVTPHGFTPVNPRTPRLQGNGSAPQGDGNA